MDHLEPVRQSIMNAVVQDPPSPWRRIVTMAIGGTTEIGFADDSELLLVCSHQGRGIIDCRTGEKVARDRNDDRRDWYGRDHLLAKGIGPLEGKLIRVAGLWGGGLSTMTSDGWQLELITLAWPKQHVLLFNPGSDLFRPDTPFTKLLIESEIRAFGFSYTGKSMVIAISSDIYVFGRE